VPPIVGDVDLLAVPGERLVDGIVDDFIDKVMESWRAGGSDVRGRTLPECLETFENLDLVGTVVVAGSAGFSSCGRL